MAEIYYLVGVDYKFPKWMGIVKDFEVIAKKGANSSPFFASQFEEQRFDDIKTMSEPELDELEKGVCIDDR